MRLVARHADVTPEGWPGFPHVLEALLRQRGIESPQQAHGFLMPSLSQLPELHTLHGIDNACERIRAAIGKDERIVVYGDYDVDGVTASAIVIEALRRHGARRVRAYIPDRMAEGYGLNAAAIEAVAPVTDLIITVDLGITGLDEVRYAAKLGVEIIVTDHHHPLDTLPETPWIVHPMLGSEPRWEPLCGAGVAWVLASALDGCPAPTIDLAALGTVADLVPLLGVNRILVAEGLRRMNAGLRPGLAALARVASVLGKPITTTTLAFAFAPRINAGGRLAKNAASIDMLLEEREEEALPQAQALQGYNQRRLDEEKAITRQALQRIGEMGEMDRAIILDGDWHPGVVGIVASRIVERYHVPTILLCRDGDALHGSGRSVPGVHLFHILEGMSELFVKFGGHAMAAGMTLHARNLERFQEAFAAAIAREDPDAFLPEIAYDLEIDPRDIDLDLAEQIERMAPFGVGHPTPIFLLRCLQLTGLRAMGGDGSHLKAALGPLSVVAFRMAHRREEMQEPLDLAFTIDRNEWNGRVSVQLVARDFLPIHRASTEFLPYDEALRAFLMSIRYNTNRHGDGLPDVRVLDEVEARRWIEDIAADPVGSLLLCALPGTVDAVLDILARIGAKHRVVLCRGNPPDHPRALGAVVLAPTPEHAAFRPYRRALWCDGLWDEGCARALSGLEQAVFNAPGWQEARAEAAERALPDVATLRALWRRLRDRSEDGTLTDVLVRLRDIASPIRAEMGLYALRDAGYIYFHEEGPANLRLTQGKGDPSSQGFYAQMSAWRDAPRIDRASSALAPIQNISV